MNAKPHQTIQYGARELFSLIFRLGEKIKDKFIWTKEEIDEANVFLHHFKKQLKKKNSEKHNEIFGEKGKYFHVRPFKRGYNAKSITFKTKEKGIVKRWVLKIGHRISPVVDYGDPATYEFFLEHKRHLDLLRTHTKDHQHLGYLISEPQEVIWGEVPHNGKEKKTTLAIQPFIKIVKDKRIQTKLTSEEKKQLLRELKAFKILCNDLISEHHVRPDLLGEGNLVVAKFGKEYHLVLLDIGLVNIDAPLPITQTVMEFASQQTMSRMESLLK